MKTCAYCGSAFERRAKFGTIPKYCSASCRNAMAHKRAKADGRYEEWKAKAQAKRKPASFTLVCDQCGEVFESGRSNTMYCSKVCGHKAYNERRKKDGRLKSLTVQLKDKQAEWNRIDRAQNGSIRKRYPDTATRHDTKRRLRITSTSIEIIKREEIYERDGWKCQLCGRRVDRKRTWPDPMAASLDHVVPISLGGEHTRANLQLAHLRCNVSKGNRGGGEQLALIG